MRYEIIKSPEFEAEFNNLSPSLQRETNKQIEKLRRGIEGIRLKAELSEFYSVHFHKNQYRIIYTKEQQQLQLIMIYVGKRNQNKKDDVYKIVKKMLKK